MDKKIIRGAALAAVMGLCAAAGQAKDGNDGNRGQGAGGNNVPKQQQQQQHQKQRQQQQQEQQHQQEKKKKQEHQEQQKQRQQSPANSENMKKRGEDSDNARDGGDGDGKKKPAKAAHDSNESGEGRKRQGDGEADDAGKAKAAQSKGDKDGNEGERQEAVDHREKNQARRIHNGVKHGQLTPEEIDKLDAQEKALSDAEAKFKSDGKLTRDESRQLQKQLNEASEQIWASRHDTEGNQRSVVRLGKEVVARDDLTQRIESGELAGPEARKFAADFRKMIAMKKRLSGDDLSDEQRAKVQDEYDEMLGNYFQINEDKQSNEK
jgi:hypothetical protein